MNFLCWVGFLLFFLLPLFQRFILPSCFALFAVSLLIPKIPYLDSWDETLLHGIEEIVFFLGRFALTTGRIPIELAIFCSLLGLFFVSATSVLFCFLVSLFLPLLLQRLLSLLPLHLSMLGKVIVLSYKQPLTGKCM